MIDLYVYSARREVQLTHGEPPCAVLQFLQVPHEKQDLGCLAMALHESRQDAK